MVEIDSPKEDKQTGRRLMVKNGLIIASIAFLIYWIFFILTPSLNSSSKTKEEVESLKLMMTTLDEYIKQEQNKKSEIDNNIQSINKEIRKIDSSVLKLKNQKIIIKEYYHEKINSVDTFSDDEIDKFLSDRYPSK
jgi:hypothetical protein